MEPPPSPARELSEADLVLCEDTRRTRTLLERHGIQAKLVSYHRHNEAKRVDELLPRLEGGERIALASDAGLPGVNDPGARLISAAIERDLEVTVLPGPSAVETALVASGLVGERYSFVGYLPRRREALDRLWEETASWSGPVSRSSRQGGCRGRCARSRRPIQSARSPFAGS